MKQFKDAIYDLKKKGGIIIFSSHQMEHIEEFCEKLVILVKGKVVLSGYLKDIKKEYQKMNIFIDSDVSKAELEKLDGVIEVLEINGERCVKVESDDIIDNVFDVVKKHKVKKFVVEEASLNEIFIDKVGEVL